MFKVMYQGVPGTEPVLYQVCPTLESALQLIRSEQAFMGDAYQNGCYFYLA